MGFDAARVHGPATKPLVGMRSRGESGLDAAGASALTAERKPVPWLVFLGIAVPLAIGIAWLATSMYPARAVTAQSEAPQVARVVAPAPAYTSPRLAPGAQSLQPAPVNVPLAKQRIAEMFPGIDSRLESADAPSVTQEPGSARYTWALAPHRDAEAFADARSAYVVLDAAGRLAGFGLE